MDNTICVIGMGYIGLPTALFFAASGKKVYGVDVMEDKIKLLSEGKLPFHEPGLQDLFLRAREKKTFYPVMRVVEADSYIIAVPTPQKDHKADLTYVMQALESILPFVKDDTMIVLESTIGPSDCEKDIIPFFEKHHKHIHLAHCPERAIPGGTVYEMQHNKRIVGGRTPQDAQRVKTLYSSFVSGEIHTTTLTVAAACKVMENTYRDVNIALANEFAKIADDIGFDVWEAIRLANLHPRVNIHQPGPGVGGHCIAIDPWYFVGESKKAKLIAEARKINDAMPEYVAERVDVIVKKHHVVDPVIGVLGYAYKKNVDDARETPVEYLLHLLEKKYTCMVHDPYVAFRLRQSSDLKTLLKKANIIILATDHDIYKEIPFQKYPNIVAIYDTRNAIQVTQAQYTHAKISALGGGHLA